MINLKVSTQNTEMQPEDRKYWVKVLTQIAEPVLENLSKGELKKQMPLEAIPGQEENRRAVSHLEAFGRLMSGIAPWLELANDDSAEGAVRAHFIHLAEQSLSMAVNPQSPDFMNFSNDGQPLVD